MQSLYNIRTLHSLWLTPPCVNIIIKKKIKNVYYAFEDPDKNFQKSKKILKKKKLNQN